MEALTTLADAIHPTQPTQTTTPADLALLTESLYAGHPVDLNELRQAEKDVPLHWKPGDVILELYDVLDLLGQGGMGTVFKVYHRRWNLELAVKTPLPETLQHTGKAEAFIREAETWVNLGLHPHVVTCYYVRALGGLPRVFAEYVEGGSLKDWMQDGRLYEGGRDAALVRMLDVLIQVTWGLGHAHREGLVHQDVKPGNVLVTTSGVAKVTDFGLARVSSGGVVEGSSGTPAYRSPEQSRGGRVGAATDVWSFGVLALEMFVGGVMWPSGTVAGAVLLEYERGALQVDERIPRMPEALLALLRGCLSKDPSGRPSGMGEIAGVLQEIYEQETGGAYGRALPASLLLRADGLNNRGVSLLDLGKEVEARACWEAALQHDPQHLGSVFNVGYLQWQQAEVTDEALVKALTGLEDGRGTDREYWRCLGWVHYERGDAAAIEAIQASAHRIEDAAFLAAIEDEDRPLGQHRRTFEGHTDRIISVSFSPEGRYVLSASADQTMRVWELATGREMHRFEGLARFVKSVCFSPDGRYVLAGGEDGRVRLWAVETGQEIRCFDGHTSSVLAVCFSRDGRYVLSGAWDGTMRVWEAETGRAIRHFERLTGLQRTSIASVHFSPDGQYMLSSRSRVVVLTEAETGREIRRFEGKGYDALAVFSPDSQFVLSGGVNEPLWLYEVKTGRDIYRFDGFEERIKNITSACFSPDGRYVVGGGGLLDQTVRTWDVETGREIRRMEANAGGVTSVCFSFDSRYVLTVHDGRSTPNAPIPHGWTMRLWEAETGRAIRCFRNHTGPIYSVCFSPDGRCLLSGGHDRSVQIFSIYYPDDAVRPGHPYPLLAQITTTSTQREQQERLRTCLLKAETARALHHYADAMHWLDEAQSIPGYERDREVIGLRTQYGAEGQGIRTGLKGAWLLHRWSIGSALNDERASFSPDGRYVLSPELQAGKLLSLLWGLERGRAIRHFPYDAFFSPDARHILSKEGELVEVESGHVIRSFEGQPVAFSSEGRYVLSLGLDQSLLLLERQTGRVLRRFAGAVRRSRDQVQWACFTPDDQYVIAGWAPEVIRKDSFEVMKEVVLWEVESGREVKRFTSFSTFDQLTKLRFSPDGKYVLAKENQGTVMSLWSIRGGREVERFDGYTSGCFSPDADGRTMLLALGSKAGAVRPWPDRFREHLNRFEGHTGAVHAICFSPQGRYALSTGVDETIRLWDTRTASELHQLNAGEPLRSMVFSPDGRYLLSSGQTVQVWAFDWKWTFPGLVRQQ